MYHVLRPMFLRAGHIVLSLLFVLLLIGEGMVPCVDLCAPESSGRCLEEGAPAAGHNDGDAGDVAVCHCVGLCRCIPAIVPIAVAHEVPSLSKDRYLIHRFILLPTVAPSPPDHIPLC